MTRSVEPPPALVASKPLVADHDSVTRRIVIASEEPDDSMEMTAVRPKRKASELSASLDELLDITMKRAPALSPGDSGELDENDLTAMEPDADAGETIALPGRRAQTAGGGAPTTQGARVAHPGPREARGEGKPGGARPELVDARQRLVAVGTRTGHASDPRRRR